MMMPKRETMALMIALRPAAMALTMAMMQFPIVRNWRYYVSIYRGEVREQRDTYNRLDARYYGTHCSGVVVV
jgi:hypothetical protein